MSKMLSFFFVATGCFFIGQQVQAQRPDTSRVNLQMTQATVYFGYGAELTHTGRVITSPATRTILLEGLGTQVDPASLQISCPEDVTILSQRYSIIEPGKVAGVVNPEIRRWQDSIRQLTAAISRIDNLIDIDQETLVKTGTLIEATLGADGSRTIVSAEVLKLVEYYNARIEKSKTNIYLRKESRKTMVERIGDIHKTIEVLNTANNVNSRPYGQLTLQVICKKSGEIPVSLSYYTRNAGWTPVYDIRVNSKTNKMKLVYKASVTQTTGVDWKGSKLTLSTGTPTSGVTAPVLTAWYLQLYVPELYKQLQGRAAGMSAKSNTLQSYRDDNAMKEVIITEDNGTTEPPSIEPIDPSTLQQFTTLREGQLNTNFDIDLPYEIASDGQMHNVTIRDQEGTRHTEKLCSPAS